MKCPRCLTELYCPCKHCAERSAGKPLWMWPDGNTCACSICGTILPEYDFDGPPKEVEKNIAKWRKWAEKEYGKDYLESFSKVAPR